MNEPTPNYEIEKLTKNFLKNDYKIKSKVRKEKISELKYKKLSVKQQIEKHSNKMRIASIKRERITSQENLISRGGSRDGDRIDSKNRVFPMWNKLDTSINQSDLSGIV